MALGMSPGAMGGKIGSGIGGPTPKKTTSRRGRPKKPSGGGMSPGERKAKTGFAVPKEQLSQQFFKGPVSDDRLRRRLQQDKEERDFIQSLKIAPGTTNLLQEQAPVFNPMTGQYERTTLAQKRQQLANKYGPTFREILGDIGYGIGSIGRGLGDFIGKGGVIGSVLSDLYGRVKSGTQQGIETVGGLYDNLRNAFKGESQFVTPQAQGGIFEGQPIRTGIETLTPQFPYNFETIMKPRPDPLLPSEMSQEQFMESFPELYSENPSFKNISSFNIDTYQPGYLPEGFSNVSIGNPLFRNVSYEPIRVSDMDMTGVTADASQQDIDRINKMRQLRGMDPQSIYDMRDIFQLSPELTLEDIQGIKEGTITQPTGIFAKDGGSVDKYAGLGYKLK